MSNRKKTSLWVCIDSVETAREAAKQGMWTAILVAIFTAVVTVIFMTMGETPEGFPEIDAWAFWDVGLFVAVAWGIHKMSRIAAVAGLGLYVLGQVLIRISMPSIAPGGLWVAGLFILGFVNGVRGTFAYHRLRRAALTEEN